LTDDAEMTLSGSAFQILVEGTGKAWLWIVVKFEDGAARWLVAADWSVHQSDTLTTRVIGARCLCEVPGVLCGLAWQ